MSKKRLYEFFFSRMLLAHGLKTTDEHQGWEIIERKQKPPTIKVKPNKTINCSITHSPTWVGIIFSNDACAPKVGLDIETIKNDWSIAKAQLFCSDSQIDYAYKLPNSMIRNRFFTTIWTQKEAFFKSGGKSIFNKEIELNTSANTKYTLVSQTLAQDSIMSIFCESSANFLIHEVSFINNQFQ